MKAVVLVGGFGTRLRPLTLSTNKQMLPVVDRPMIERVLAGLQAHGVTDAVLSLGYEPDAFLEAYPERMCAGVRLEFAVEGEPLDTAGAIRFAATEAGIDETFLVVNGDVLHDVDVAAVWAAHQKRGAEGTITLTPVDDPSRYGVVPLDGEGWVEAFIEKPPPGEAPTNWINAGIYVLEPSVLQRIPAGPSSIERRTFPEMVADRTLSGVQSDAYWIDAGTPATYLQAQLDLTDGTRSEQAEPVSAEAAIDDGATVQHSVVMGGAEVADGVVLSGSAVLPDAVIEKGARIAGSIVGPGARVGEGATLTGLCVLGAGAVVEPGATLDGARVPDPD